MRTTLNLSQSLLLFAIVPLALELTFIGVMFEVLARLDFAQQARTHSINASSQLAKFTAALVDSGAAIVSKDLTEMKSTQKSPETIGAGAVNARSEAENTLIQSRPADIEESFKKLVKYLAEDPLYWEIAEKLDKKNVEAKGYFEKAAALAEQGNLSESYRQRAKGLSVVNAMIATSKDVVEKNAGISAKLTQEEERLKSAIKQVLAASLLVSALGAGALAYLLNQTIVANLKKLTSNVENLAAQRKSEQTLTGKDEFAVLDSAFRAMFSSVAKSRSAEKLIVESAVDLILSLDEKGIVKQINAASKRLLGYGPEELVGISLTEIIVDEQKEQLTLFIAETMDSSQSKNLQLRLLARDGHEVETAWSAIWSDSELSLFCVAHDLSQRMRTERLKQEITAMISHDLRTPLTSLQIAVELFASGAYGRFSEELSDKLKASSSKTIEAMDLINDLLDIEKLEQSTIELSFEPWPAGELIESAWSDIAPMAEQKNVRLTTDSEAIELLVDRDQFVRVLRNLLRNSCTCSPADGQIKVSAEQDGENIVISIEDEGPLVSPEELQFVFDRFHQSDEAKSPRVSGMELSLAVCRALVDAQGGRLDATKTDGERFRFAISLPV